MSKLTNTVRQSWLRESKMDILIVPPSLGILPNSSKKVTPKHIKEWLMLSQQDSPASHSQSPEKDLLKKIKETSGLTRLNAFAWFDHDSSSWRTYQGCLLTNTYDTFTGRWPKSGMMLDGISYPLPTVEQTTKGSGGGLWPTPDATHRGTCIDNRTPQQKGGGGRCLERDVAAKMWPSPSAEQAGEGDLLDELETKDGESAKQGERAYNPKTKKHVQITLNRAVTMWPTPKERDWRSGKGAQDDKASNLDQRIGGQLNPDWVEWLMGWPIGWTSLEPLKELIWLDWDIDPADMKEAQGGWHTPRQIYGEHPGMTSETHLTGQAINSESCGPIPRVATGIKDRVNRLKAIGNGQVPIVAATAWRWLTGEEE